MYELMTIFIECPHCLDYVEIIQINCGIFRHGVFKQNNQQLNPHASKLECELVVKLDLINGCGKPFKLVYINGQCMAQKCDYI
jgi:hypothetical protein